MERQTGGSPLSRFNPPLRVVRAESNPDHENPPRAEFTVAGRKVEILILLSKPESLAPNEVISALSNGLGFALLRFA